MIINIAKDFSDAPGGRSYQDGPFTGEKFREQLLEPALDSNEKITIILDGTFGYPPSFLEEAFGGLIRTGRYNKKKLETQFTFISRENPNLPDKIWYYIDHPYG